MKKCVSPEQPGGVRDYLPKDMISRQKLIDTIRRVFVTFGFDPLETPAMERLEVLTGDRDDFDMAIYETSIYARKTEVREDHRTALRFDLTVPLARFVASNPELPKPFKRYQIGNVWRAEKPQKGRFREFIQFDADTVGTPTVQADVEIIWLMHEVMRSLGIEKFTVKVNNRKVLNGLPQLIDFDPQRINDLLRCVDKIDKIGPEGVKRELMTTKEEFMDSLAFSEEQISKLFAFLDLNADSTLGLILKAQELFPKDSIAQEGLTELLEISESLNHLGQKNWKIDFSVARGLGYYTGPVFETTLDELPSIGSIFSGGRYDGLVNNFSDMVLPATGASVGVDRLYAALQELGKIEEKSTNLQALVLRLDEKFIPVYNGILSELRGAGISASLYLGGESSFKGQFAACVKLCPSFLIIYGENEARASTIQIKNLKTRQQITVSKTELITSILGFLGA